MNDQFFYSQFLNVCKWLQTVKYSYLARTRIWQSFRSQWSAFDGHVKRSSIDPNETSNRWWSTMYRFGTAFCPKIFSSCSGFGSWASYQIRKFTGCACAGYAGNAFPATDFIRIQKTLDEDPSFCVMTSLYCELNNIFTMYAKLLFNDLKYTWLWTGVYYTSLVRQNSPGKIPYDL